jgi:hypothetical protein
VAGGSNEARSYAVVAEESASLYSHVRNPDRNRTCCQLLSASSTVQFWPRHAVPGSVRGVEDGARQRVFSAR